MISATHIKDTEHPVPQINGTIEQQQAIAEFHHQFNVTTESARIIVKQFVEEMEKGLDHEGATGKIKKKGNVESLLKK